MKAVLNILPPTCGGCAQIIKNHLDQEMAIQNVTVLPQFGKVRIEYDSDQLALSKISKMMAEIGYPVRETIEA